MSCFALDQFAAQQSVFGGTPIYSRPGRFDLGSFCLPRDDGGTGGIDRVIAINGPTAPKHGRGLGAQFNRDETGRAITGIEMLVELHALQSDQNAMMPMHAANVGRPMGEGEGKACPIHPQNMATLHLAAGQRRAFGLKSG
jgi:hypothetical protein